MKAFWMSLFCIPLTASAGRIIQVERTLSLTKDASEVTDYILDVGKDDGLSPGTWLDVYRKRAVTDLLTFDHKADLKIWVGQLEVIQSDNSLAVARLRGIANPHDEPLLEYPLPMTGDLVEIGKARVNQSMKTERVPGMIKVSKRGGRAVIEKDARKYLNRVVAYLKRNQKELRAVHLLSASRDHASAVAQYIRQQYGSRTPPLRYIEKANQTSVVVLVKKCVACGGG